MPRPEKSTRRMPKVSFQSKRKNTLATETKSPVKSQLTRGGSSSSQMHANKQYSFKDKNVDSLFKLLKKSNRLKLSEVRRPEEVSKTDNPNYCLYHRMLGHPTKSYYIFKDILQVLIDMEVLKLHSEQKKVTANMTSFLQFGVQPPTLAGVVSIPKGELRVLNIDPHHQQEKGLILVLSPQGEIMWVHSDLVEAQQWTIVTNRKSKGKAKVSPCIVVCASSRKVETDVPSLTDLKEEPIVLAAELNAPLVAEARSGQSYSKNTTRWWQIHLYLPQSQPGNPRSNPWRNKKRFSIPRSS